MSYDHETILIIIMMLIIIIIIIIFWQSFKIKLTIYVFVCVQVRSVVGWRLWDCVERQTGEFAGLVLFEFVQLFHEFNFSSDNLTALWNIVEIVWLP